MTTAGPNSGERGIRGIVIVFFRHLHGLLAIGAAAQRWWVGELGPATDWRGILAAGLATIAGYGYLRLVRTLEPDLIPSANIHWARRNRSVVIALVVSSGLAAVALCWGQILVYGPWSLLVLAVLGLYLMPFQGADGRSIGLREIPGMKTILVAAGWTFVTMGVAAAEPGEVVRSAPWVAAVQFCFFLALAIATDIGDLKYDRPELKTVPQLIGVRGAKVFAVILMLPVIWFYVVMCAFLIINGASLLDGLNKFALPLLGAVIASVAIAMVRVDRPKWYFAILLDGMVLLIPLLGWLGQAL